MVYQTVITQENMLRRYPQDNKQYINVIEKLALGTKKIMEDIHTVLKNQINFYIHSIDLRDQKQRMGAEIVGYLFPHVRPSVKEGQHFIAMKHPKIPQGKIEFKDFFEFRVTYSVDSHEWKYCLENYSDTNNTVEGLLSQQLASYGRGIQNFMAFVSYLIFHNPRRGKNNGKNNEDWEEKLDCSEAIDNKDSRDSRKSKSQTNPSSEYRKTYKEWAEPEFENFIENEFNPKNALNNGDPKGYPFSQRVLALEELEVVTNRKNIVTVNRLFDKAKDIRKKLRNTKRVTYNPRDNMFYREVELAEEVSHSLSLREQILFRVKDMVYNTGEFMVDLNKYGKFNPFIKASDLVLIISYKDALNLKLGVPRIMEPQNWEFTTSDLGVGQIIETKWLEEGDAYILHKDVIKLWITDLPTGQAEYPEHSVVNRWMDIMFYLDMITWFPVCYITPKTPKSKPEPSSS